MSKVFLIRVCVLLFISLSLSSVHAEQVKSEGVNDMAPALSSKAAFKKAYTSYQTFSEKGEWDKSLEHAKKAYELGQDLYVDKPETLAALADNYGLNLMNLYQFDQAVPILKKALGIYEKIHGVDSPELILPLLDISRSMAKPKKGAAIKKYLERAIKISVLHYGENSANHGQILVDSALIYSKTYQSSHVKNYLDKGYKILQETLGDTHPRTGIAAYNLGRYEYSKNRFKKSVDYLETALKTFEFPDKPSNPYELKTHGILVEAYEKLNQSDKATKHCLAIGRMTPRTDVQDYLPLLKIAPRYPASAASRGIQGSVTVQYDVDEMGFVKNPVVVESTARTKALEQSAIEAALKFRYAPGFENGEAVVTEGVKNRFTYTLSR